MSRPSHSRPSHSLPSPSHSPPPSRGSPAYHRPVRPPQSISPLPSPPSPRPHPPHHHVYPDYGPSHFYPTVIGPSYYYSDWALGLGNRWSPDYVTVRTCNNWGQCTRGVPEMNCEKKNDFYCPQGTELTSLKSENGKESTFMCRISTDDGSIFLPAQTNERSCRSLLSMIQNQ